MFLPAAFAAENINPSGTPELTLDKCLKLGLQNNNQIFLADSNILMNQKLVQQAFSGYLPTVSYRISDYRPYYPITSGYDGNSNPINTQKNYYDKNLSVTQILFNGGQTTYQYRNADLNLKMAISDKRKTGQDLVYQIKTAFYDLWLKQQNLLTALASQDNMGQHYQLVLKMYDRGIANKLELYQAQGQWEEQKVAAVTTKNEVSQSRLTLATLIGIDKFKEFAAGYDLHKFSPAGPDGTIQDLIEQAYQTRPEMEKLRLNVQLCQNYIKSQQIKYYPTIGLTCSYDDQSDQLTNHSYSYSWYLMGSVSGTVFDGFSTRSAVAAAKQNLISAQYQLKLQQNQIFTDVAKALQSLQQSRELIQFTGENVEIARERLRLTELQYENAKADTTDFIDAQTALDTALNNYYSQVMNYLKAAAKLDNAMGKDNIHYPKI
jgi:outer membrane protein